MSRHVLSLERLREAVSTNWILTVSGIAFVVSQLTMAVVIHRVGWVEFLRLQCVGFHASDYLRVFGQWENEGVIELYRAHLVFDNLHWVWYTVFFTALLARLFDLNRIPSKFNFVLVFPLASGLLDVFENRCQHFFLSTPDFITVVDPLPFLSTIASGLKWLLAANFVLISAVLCVRAFLTRTLTAV